MFEKYLLVRHDFQNVSENGQITGFQVKIKIPYYRGVYLSQLENVKLKVDEEEFDSSVMTFTVAEHGPNVPSSPTKTYTFREMESATTKRWWFGDTATLTVKKPGGLKPAIYDVQLALVARNSYRPKTDPEGLYARGPMPGAAGMGAPGAEGGPMIPGVTNGRIQGPMSGGYLVKQKMTLVK
jgi:hypothetical protein